MKRPRMTVRLVVVALAALVVVTSAGSLAASPVVKPLAAGTASCRTVAASLTQRDGPGTAFQPVGSLLKDSLFTPISFVKAGVPNGSWVEIDLGAGGSSTFLPADDQSIKCQQALSTLPVAKAPPPPAPPRQRVGRKATDGPIGNPVLLRGPATNLNDGQYVIIPGVSQAQLDMVVKANNDNLGAGDRVRFGDAVGFGVEVFDARENGRTNGNGIKEVHFDVSTGGKTVYQTVETQKPYCIFSDENGQCNVFRFSKMGYKWPDTRIAKGLPRPTGETRYEVTITIVAKRDNAQAVWSWSFDQNAIALELQ